MTEKKLIKKYSDLMKEVELATGRKEVISLLHKADSVRLKISKNISISKTINNLD
tara:strand:- start:218 stop:382 length:165 start_codon:yes stop_codon:yes gene_type:complete